jgi:hypothetical protein
VGTTGVGHALFNNGSTTTSTPFKEYYYGFLNKEIETARHETQRGRNACSV